MQGHLGGNPRVLMRDVHDFFAAHGSPPIAFYAFFDQPEEDRRSVIGSARVKVAVEAAVRQGWDAIIGDGPFIGMTGFGASGPYKAVYQHFGITAEAVAQAALARLGA